MQIHIRDFDLENDKSAALSFIDGSQRYEYEIEPDRRLDSKVAEEHLAFLLAHMKRNQGRIFVAEGDGRARGWAVFFVEQHPLFVVEDERTFGYIAELFVDEELRGQGVGRALIAVCEDEARRLGLRNILIGVLAGNARAARVYAGAGFAPYSTELRKRL